MRAVGIATDGAGMVLQWWPEGNGPQSTSLPVGTVHRPSALNYKKIAWLQSMSCMAWPWAGGWPGWRGIGKESSALTSSREVQTTHAGINSSQIAVYIEELEASHCWLESPPTRGTNDRGRRTPGTASPGLSRNLHCTEMRHNPPRAVRQAGATSMTAARSCWHGFAPMAVPRPSEGGTHGHGLESRKSHFNMLATGDRNGCEGSSLLHAKQGSRLK